METKAKLDGKEYELHWYFKKGGWENSFLLPEIYTWFPPTAGVKAVEISAVRCSKVTFKKDKKTGLLRSRRTGPTPKQYGFYIPMDKKYFESHSLHKQMYEYLVDNYKHLSLEEGVIHNPPRDFTFTREKLK